jgi:ribokinase
MDLVVATGTLPARGETVFGSDFRRFGGGKGANQSVAAARMGARVSLVGRVGDDEFGTTLLDDLRAAGVDVSAVGCVEGPTGTALITVDSTGANTIVFVSGANARLGVADLDAARAVIESSQVLLLQLEVPIEVTVRAAEIARDAGVAVILNPSPAGPLPDELLACVSYLVLNETELAVLAPSALGAEDLLSRGVGAVVLTLGERGARLISRPGARDVPAYRVETVDTTAAGDAFVGAFAAILPERGVDAALDTAAAAGALATTRWGAQPSLPTRSEVEALIRRGHGQRLSKGVPRSSS